MNDTVLINKDVVEQAVESTYHPCTRILIEGLKRLKAWDVLAEWDKAREIVDKRFRTALAEPNRAQKMRDAGYTRRPTLREMAESEPCQYPDCVDNGPDVECTRWLLDECLREDYKPKRPAEPVQEHDDKDTAGIRWQLCLLAQTEEFSEGVRNQIGRGVWLIDRLRAALAEPVQSPEDLGYVPLSADGKHVFIDGIGEVPLDFGALAQPVQEPVCDKDPRGCYSVRCQLGKVCKHTAPPQRKENT